MVKSYVREVLIEVIKAYSERRTLISETVTLPPLVRVNGLLVDAVSLRTLTYNLGLKPREVFRGGEGDSASTTIVLPVYAVKRGRNLSHLLSPQYDTRYMMRVRTVGAYLIDLSDYIYCPNHAINNTWRTLMNTPFMATVVDANDEYTAFTHSDAEFNLDSVRIEGGELFYYTLKLRGTLPEAQPLTLIFQYWSQDIARPLTGCMNTPVVTTSKPPPPPQIMLAKALIQKGVRKTIPLLPPPFNQLLTKKRKGGSSKNGRNYLVQG